MMIELLKKYDDLLKDDGPAAIVMKQWLRPVLDDVVFPPTYAAPKGDSDKKPRYNRDPFGPKENDRFVCSVDSIGSQANRIEPLFKKDKFGHLVPQIAVTHGGGQTHLLDAGHRIADAIVRFSELLPEIHNAFIAYRDGNPEPMARLAPTSLVFGAWDSRGTQIKIPRLISFRIDATDVQELTRSAQYNPATDYVLNGLIDEVDENTGSDLGFASVPAGGQLGGIKIFGEIVRSGSLNLAMLQSLGNGTDVTEVQRYLLGISLVSLTAFENTAFTLRQGCQLVADPKFPMTIQTIRASGEAQDFVLTASNALTFATAAARCFNVGENRSVAFDSTLANRIRKLWTVEKTREALKNLAKVRPLTMHELDAFEKSKLKKGKKEKGDAQEAEERNE
jgi:CRISPR-associated protein Csb1